MKRILISFVCALAAVAAFAQPAGGGRPGGGFPASFAGFFGPRVDTIKVWPNGAPNAFEVPKQASTNAWGQPQSDYSEALLEVYPARNPNGMCVIMCPGGGYAMLSLTHEGRNPHDWFNARGITFCVLQYRMPRGHHDVPLSDVQEAMRIMRGRTDLGITSVGVMGCSAGGHLAATAATHYTDAATRPDFQILVYPVITMDLSFTHKGSYDGLLGENPSQELVDLYSNEKQVTADTPPCFIVFASDDFLVPPANSLRYYEALIANKVSATMFVLPSGGHGFGWNDSTVFKNDWTSALDTWLFNVAKK
jgi:acetyl esterase/lipase